VTGPHDPGPPDRPDTSRRSPKIDEILAAVAMALICLISIANVVVRYATDISFAFTEEFSVFLLVFMTLIGSALAFATDEHIRITFFVERVGPRAQRLLGRLSLAATLVVFSLVLWFGAVFAYDQWEFEETSAGLGYPTWIYSIWLPILAAVIIVRVVQRAVRGRRRRP
jgi:TRAP-type C4-dicarboxylate transport system permease small subunit